MKKILLFVVAAALTTLVYAVDEAKNPERAYETKFMRLDTNHDGVIDQTEAKADVFLSKEFGSIATNGKLNEKAYDAWRASTTAKHSDMKAKVKTGS